MIIGIGHKARNGKSTTVDYLRLKYDFNVINFADALYDECRNAQHYLKIVDGGNLSEGLMGNPFLLCIRKNDLDALHAMGKKPYIAYPPSLIGKEYLFEIGMTDKCAPLLQWWGTFFRRNMFSDRYWIDKVKKVINENPDGDYAVGDLRFKNEAEFIQNECNGVTIKVFRDETEDIGRDPNHPSEIDLDDWPFNYTLENNTTKGDLFRKVDEVMVGLGGRYEQLA